MIRKNMKLLIGIVIGIIISGFGVYAANNLSANSIGIDKSKMSKVENSNLQSALDYLYGQSEKNNLITIESGVLHKSQTYLGIVYLDPTNLERKCSEADAKANRNQDGTITGVKTGCMKWYIYKDNGTSYSAILDHNTTARVPYNSDNVNTSQKEVAEAFTSDTTGWVASLNARLITADEIANITGADKQKNWNSSSSTNWFCFDTNEGDTLDEHCAKAQGTSNYAWLFDNTNKCAATGCNIADSSTTGYWTSTAYAVNESYMWFVTGGGNLVFSSANSTYYGVRPVITISKN